MTPLERSHEDRLKALEEERGAIMRELAQLQARVAQLEGHGDELAEHRDSLVEVERGLVSLRAKVKPQDDPTTLEFNGPWNVRLALRSMHGVHLALVLLAGAVALALAWSLR